ncbi:ssDNA-binding protein [Roseomonas sp. USHLN139]|uniref:ssDNA-binding protein n=1 Tax=Roseomonas sp. USHLN139 TaxID=3081298 RepID=UPI003B0199A8
MTKLLTPNVVLSYPHLFKAVLRKNAKPDEKPQFSAAFLFDEAALTAPETKAILAAVMEAAYAKWGKKTVDTWIEEGTFELPFKKDIVSKGYPERFKRYISCASGADYPPAVVGRFKDPKTGKLEVITDARRLYPGAVVRVSVTVRCYGGEKGWKPGVKLDLANVQLIDDTAERLTAGGAGGEPDEFGSGEEKQAGTDADFDSLLG